MSTVGRYAYRGRHHHQRTAWPWRSTLAIVALVMVALAVAVGLDGVETVGVARSLLTGAEAYMGLGRPWS